MVDGTSSSSSSSSSTYIYGVVVYMVDMVVSSYGYYIYGAAVSFNIALVFD